MTSRAYAAKVTTLESGEDELGETVASLSGSMPLYAALTDLANMADPDSTDNNARRKAWLDGAKGLTAVERVAEAMREKRVRRLERGVTDLGGGYTAEQDGGDLLVRRDGLPVSRNSMLTLLMSAPVTGQRTFDGDGGGPARGEPVGGGGSAPVAGSVTRPSGRRWEAGGAPAAALVVSRGHAGGVTYQGMESTFDAAVVAVEPGDGPEVERVRAVAPYQVGAVVEVTIRQA